MAVGYEREYWGNGSKRVEELDTDEDSDTQGAGLVSARGTRFTSDPLRFTGIDLGENMPRPRRKHTYERSGDEDSLDSEQDTELDEEGYAQYAREEEEALVDSAMRRIRRAQASGRKEVKLSRKELAALESQRRRQSEGERKKKKKEQRFAVPLSQLAPTSYKENQKKGIPGALPSAESLQRQSVQPPVGWFAHPSSSRPSSSDSRRPPNNMNSDREASTSPFQYNYVRPAAPVSNSRHSSDPTVRPRAGSTRSNLPYPDMRMSQYHPSSSVPSVPSTLDPFRYMTSGPQAPYHAGSAASLRNASGSSVGTGYYEPTTRGGASAPRRQSRHFTSDDEEVSSEEENEEQDEDETSDEADAGARIGNSSTISGRGEVIVVEEREPTPEPRVTRSKNASSSLQGSPRSSPKPTPKRTGGVRKKKSSK